MSIIIAIDTFHLTAGRKLMFITVKKKL